MDDDVTDHRTVKRYHAADPLPIMGLEMGFASRMLLICRHKLIDKSLRLGEADRLQLSIVALPDVGDYALLPNTIFAVG